MIKMKHAVVPLLVLTLNVAAEAYAAPPAVEYGTVTGNATVAGRVIEVTPSTRYLNVRDGEVVTIRQGDFSFTWQVSTGPNVNAIPLGRIAPANAPATTAWVYIEPTEQYESN